MKVVLSLTALGATIAAAGCTVLPPNYALIQGRSVSLSCRDGHLTFNDERAKKMLVTPYLASQAQYEICAGDERLPLAERARQAAQKQLGATCALTGAAEPLPLNYEFSYVCGAAAGRAREPLRRRDAPLAHDPPETDRA